MYLKSDGVIRDGLDTGEGISQKSRKEYEMGKLDASTIQLVYWSMTVMYLRCSFVSRGNPLNNFRRNVYIPYNAYEHPG